MNRRDGGEVIAMGNVRSEQPGGSVAETTAGGAVDGHPAPSSAGCSAGPIGREGVLSAAPVSAVPPPGDGATSSPGGGASAQVGSSGVAAGDLRVGSDAVQKQSKLFSTCKK